MNNTNSKVRCRIHRGCHEIGGNCVEIESSGKRILLDLGLPLKDDSDTSLPNVSGLSRPDNDLLGIFISHPHPDHYGLLNQIPECVPVYMGKAARDIIKVSGFFTPLPDLGNIDPLPFQDQETIELDPFKITPYQIDHSAFDSNCFLIEVGGKRIFYSGDIRGHGRKSHLFDDFINDPPQDIDLLICEGTQVGRIPDFAYKDENSVEEKMAELFKNTDGMVLVWCSSQNIDRLVSVYEATKAVGRKLILDMYTAEILKATGAGDIPKPSTDGVRVYLPSSQKQKI